MSTDATQPSDDLSGEIVGKYILISPLGKGHFGQVYLGQDIRDPKRLVAIKILSVLLTDQKRREKFIEEGKILIRLTTPPYENIVCVYDYDTEQKNAKLLNMPFIVMSREGENLGKLYPSGSIMPLYQVVDYINQLAKALDYAHAKGVIHRDVKPANILQVKEDPDNPDNAGKIRLSDFGIAFRPEYDPVDDAIGTPAYMAPEQWNRNPCEASDQYSLAVVTYEWLYGKRPFEGTHIQLAVQHKEKLPPFDLDRSRNLIIPPAVEKVLTRALAKNPKERYKSVLAFAQALEVAISSIPKPVSLRQTFTMTRREWITVALIAIAVIASEREIEVVVAPLWQRFMGNSKTIPKDSKTRLVYGHEDKVSAVAWSPDGKNIASGGYDNTVLVWDLNKRLVTRHDHGGRVLSIAWSPDGKSIASVSDDGIVDLWDFTTGEIYGKYPKNGRPIVRVATWSAVADLAVSSGNSALVFDNPMKYNFSLPDHPFTAHTDVVNALSFSPDSNKVVSASDDTKVYVWKQENGQFIISYTGHKAEVRSVDWASQLDLIASGGDDRTVQIWGASQASLYHSYKHNGTVRAVRWSPNGQYLASGGEDAVVQLWKIDGTFFSSYTGHSDSVNAVAFSPDGKFVASASDDKTVRVWSVQ